MLDTLTVLAYLIVHNAKPTNHLQLQATFVNKASPALAWQGVPPEAGSLALIVKDKQSRYCWVVYNISPDTQYFPLNASQYMNRHNEGLNSWGKHAYHSAEKKNMVITLTVLDTRFSNIHDINGKELEQKIKGHVLAEAQAS